ncbi:MAG: ABC-F family ATP-binding cassette domain-containing protein [Lentisphaeria bacterium]|nr:ABC-F family ATP-binding cassette domain-containing protein [Lentisphaeria bacterium]MBQ8754317.1 ABC-F family ATP-binding cassette domain-containing protein [Lentisphaeria bacterium]MBQ9774780.1 ABC-F family ATP-binding cassette domain-containing protein [Lentisphaeria bacterium]
MIDFKDVTKCYGGEPILDRVSFRINPGDRVGVVGPNGAGKSTLFGIVTGDVPADHGTVALPKDHRIGILRQMLPTGASERELLEFTCDAIPELAEMTAELHALEQQLHEGFDDNDRLQSALNRHGHLQSTIEHLGAYRLKTEAEQALTNLGFNPADFHRPLKSFSGGWQMRAAMARVLISQPDILMLDEPSNYLDIPAVEWLCKFLKSFPGTLLLISHDRFLLRKLTNITLEVNNGKVTRYPGDYDYYRRERESRFKNLEAAKRNSDRKREHIEKVIDRFRAKATKAAQAKSWQKALDKMEEIELPDDLSYSGAIRFPEPPPGGIEAARIEKMTFGYDPAKPILKDIDLTIDAGDKIAFIGYNGMGKTTLLKLLAGRLKPQSGRVVPGHHSVIGYQAQEFSELLVPEQTVYDVVRGNLPAGASTAGLMNVLGSFGFSGEASEKCCKVLSGGEKIRLLFARIFVNPPNFLILDEPTTHLDVAARELLQEALRQYKGTVCIVSHDIEFVRNVATTIIAMESPHIRKYFGNYDYYLEKSAQLRSEKVTTTPEQGPEESADLAKNRRRARAQARAALADDKKKAQKSVDELESRLAALEKRQAELLEMVAVPSLKVDFAEAGKELSQVQKEIAAVETAWETAAETLENILKEIEKINQSL